MSDQPPTKRRAVLADRPPPRPRCWTGTRSTGGRAASVRRRRHTRYRRLPRHPWQAPAVRRPSLLPVEHSRAWRSPCVTGGLNRRRRTSVAYVLSVTGPKGLLFLPASGGLVIAGMSADPFFA